MDTLLTKIFKLNSNGSALGNQVVGIVGVGVHLTHQGLYQENWLFCMEHWDHFQHSYSSLGTEIELRHTKRLPQLDHKKQMANELSTTFFFFLLKRNSSQPFINNKRFTKIYNKKQIQKDKKMTSFKPYRSSPIVRRIRTKRLSGMIIVLTYLKSNKATHLGNNKTSQVQLNLDLDAHQNNVAIDDCRFLISILVTSPSFCCRSMFVMLKKKKYFLYIFPKNSILFYFYFFFYL